MEKKITWTLIRRDKHLWGAISGDCLHYVGGKKKNIVFRKVRNYIPEDISEFYERPIEKLREELWNSQFMENPYQNSAQDTQNEDNTS